MKPASLPLLFFAIGSLTLAHGSGHGPVFGMSTPTNVKGGWSLDLGFMGRVGEQNRDSMVRAMLGYGITEDLQLSISIPYSFTSAPFAPSRITGMMPASMDLEAIGSYRFFRKGTRVGTRIESTANVGFVVPGPQRPAGMMGDLRKAPGIYASVTTGIASRSHYVWAGLGNLHFSERGGDRRSNVVTYSAVWGYRPKAWQKEYPHWDWRVFAELTGDDASKVRRGGVIMPGTSGRQVFLGPTALGIHKNYAIEAGIQWPVYRSVGPMLQQERYRFAINFSRFF